MPRVPDRIPSDSVLNSDQRYSREMEDAMDVEFADIDAGIAKRMETKTDLVLLQRPGEIAMADRAAHQADRRSKAAHHPPQNLLHNTVSASALRARFRPKTKQVNFPKSAAKISTPPPKPGYKPSPRKSGRQQARTSPGKSSQAQRSSSSLRPSLRFWKSAYHILKKQLAETHARLGRLESRLSSSRRRARKAERVSRRLASALTVALGGSSDGPEVDAGHVSNTGHAHGLNGYEDVGGGEFVWRQSVF